MSVDSPLWASSQLFYTGAVRVVRDNAKVGEVDDF